MRASRFVRSRSGAAAVEMALIAPMLIGALLLMTDLGMTLFNRLDMQSAVRAGIQYAMNGGRNLETTKEIVLQSWPDRPADAVVDASRYCLCGETETACTNWCEDHSAPQSFTRITAHGTLGMFVFSEPIYSDETARVR